MNNMSSYYGLTDSRMSASEKDLPVCTELCIIVVWKNSKIPELWNTFDMIVHCVYKLGVGGLNKILGSWLRQIFYSFTFLPHLVNIH